MKKFYETPAVEFTGFDVEDIITTSGDPIDTTSTDPEVVTAVAAAVNNYNDGANQGAATYGAYTW